MSRERFASTFRLSLLASLTCLSGSLAPAGALGASLAPPVIPHKGPIGVWSMIASYSPYGPAEQQVLGYTDADEVDAAMSAKIAALGITPPPVMVMYTNIGNIYLSLFLDWLNYADAHGVSREAAFYHAAAPTAFYGAGASTVPVNQFWLVRTQALQNPPANPYIGVSNGYTTPMPLPIKDQTTLVFGYPEKFRTVNVAIVTAAAASSSYVVEYPTAVDNQGNPAQWASLPLKGDTSSGFSGSGTLTFDPPSDWVAANIGTNAFVNASGIQRYSGKLFAMRVRALGTPAGGSVATVKLTTDDYVGAHGTSKGTIPVFDDAADRDHDGYLNDQEYANRAAGKDARFKYQSRIFSQYGQMRFTTNPASRFFGDWVVDYEKRYLATAPLVNGLFVDNTLSIDPNPKGISIEYPATTPQDYAGDLAALLARLRTETGKILIPNISYGTDPRVMQATGAAWMESLMKPFNHVTPQVTDVINTVTSLQATTTPSPNIIVDCHVTSTYPATDARARMSCLSYYYLYKDKNTFFTLAGGDETTGTSITRRWFPAEEYDLGQPAGSSYTIATGSDPSNSETSPPAAREYTVFGRSFAKGFVLFKPLAYDHFKTTAPTTDDSATIHPLGAAYQLLNQDGTLSAPITSVSLDNGQGAILIPASGSPIVPPAFASSAASGGSGSGTSGGTGTSSTGSTGSGSSSGTSSTGGSSTTGTSGTGTGSSGSGSTSGTGTSGSVMGSSTGGSTSGTGATPSTGGPASCTTCVISGVQLAGAAADAMVGAVVKSGHLTGSGSTSLVVSSNDVLGALYVFTSPPQAGSQIIDPLNGTMIDGKTGFLIYSPEGRRFGSTFAIGDVNGDGYDDILASTNASDSKLYLIWGGHTASWKASQTIDSMVAAGLAMEIDTPTPNAYVSGTLGNIYGSGGRDIVIADLSASPLHGYLHAGAVYVIAGGKTLADGTAWPSRLAVSTALAVTANQLQGVTKPNGFELDGEAANAQLGGSGVLAVDLNSDGYDDIVAANAFANVTGTNRGTAYVIFGGPTTKKGTPWAGQQTVNCSFLTAGGACPGAAVNGVRFDGETLSSLIGYGMAAGDFNGDGRADLVIGDYSAINVVWGKPSGWATPQVLNLAFLGAGSGVRFTGITGQHLAVGDFNGDGIADLFVGNPAATPNGNTGAGAAYAVFGKSFGWSAAQAFYPDVEFDGQHAGDNVGSSVGATHLYSTKYAEIAIGADTSSPGGISHAGSAYVIQGQDRSALATSYSLTTWKHQ